MFSLPIFHRYDLSPIVLLCVTKISKYAMLVKKVTLSLNKF
jgi:hypothetical protein